EDSSLEETTVQDTSAIKAQRVIAVDEPAPALVVRNSPVEIAPPNFARTEVSARSPARVEIASRPPAREAPKPPAPAPPPDAAKPAEAAKPAASVPPKAPAPSIPSIPAPSDPAMSVNPATSAPETKRTSLYPEDSFSEPPRRASGARWIVGF